MKDKSERHELADRIASMIKEKGLNNPRGGYVFLRTRNDRKYYSVAFSSGRSLSGVINVYATNFIQIEYTYGKMKGEPVFESEKAAVDFFQKGIVLKKWESALKVPNKPEKDENS